jgi:hypothetical protein
VGWNYSPQLIGSIVEWLIVLKEGENPPSSCFHHDFDTANMRNVEIESNNFQFVGWQWTMARGKEEAFK